MLKSKPKVQKKLAKLVLAALLCTSGIQAVVTPSVAEATFAEVVAYGTVTKGGVTVDVTNVNSQGGHLATLFLHMRPQGNMIGIKHGK